MTVSLEAPTLEKLRTTIKLTADPVANPPEFAILECDVTPSEVSWSDGAWLGAWNSATTKIDAETPLLSHIGGGGTIELGEGRWQVWLRVTVGAELIVRKLDQVIMRGFGATGGGSGGGGASVSVHFDFADTSTFAVGQIPEWDGSEFVAGDDDVGDLVETQFPFPTPTTVWNVTHNLNRRPVVTAFLTGGIEFVPDIDHIDANSFSITHAIARSGDVYVA